MTPEQLLIQRYKVIAPYPGIKAHGWKVGDILDRNWCEYQNGDEDAGVIEWQVSDYPINFQPLPWWSDRAVKEMPDFVKRVDMVDSHDNPVPDEYIKVKKHFASNSGDWRDDKYSVFAPDDSDISSISYSGYLPATLEEYKEWKQSKNK